MNTVVDAQGSRAARDAVRPRLQDWPAFAEAVLDDIAAGGWEQAFDAIWLGQDWRRRECHLAADVEFAP